MFLPLSQSQLQEIGAENTVNEIQQQPTLWRKTLTLLKDKQGEIDGFFSALERNHNQVRFIFTGAGTSAFVGDTIVPYLYKKNNNPQWSFEAIATTDLVSSPTYFFKQDIPTVLISFARSGSSPESVASVELGEKLINQFYQIVITCNESGELAQKVAHDKNSLLVLMPPESNDLGFAMTSSFTTMLLAGLMIFERNSQLQLRNELEVVSFGATDLLEKGKTYLDGILEFDFERIIYLGSGVLKGISRESALKMLELTSGKIVSMYESPLGFRHGPKSVLNDRSLIVFYLSQDMHTRRYDLDLLKELHYDNVGKILVVDSVKDENIEQISDWYIDLSTSGETSEDVINSLAYVIFAQMLAVGKSLSISMRVDNPSVNGLVNRVVKGVTIYPYDR